MYKVKTTFHSGKVKTIKIKDRDMTDNILAELEFYAMNGYCNIASCEVTRNGKVVMYGEN